MIILNRRLTISAILRMITYVALHIVSYETLSLKREGLDGKRRAIR